MNIQRAFHILVGTILLSLPQQGFSSSLHTAAAEGKTEDILKLLKNGADINERDKGGLTPLLLAAHFGYTETVSCLLDHGADIKATDKRGRTAILTAFTQVGKWLLFSSGQVATIKKLVEKGADVNAEDAGGATIMMVAIEAGDLEMVKFLVESGYDVKKKRAGGQTTLMHAAQKGYPEIVKYLIDKGVAIDVKDDEGFTALFFATSNSTGNRCTLEPDPLNEFLGDRKYKVRIDHLEVVRLLVAKGADVNTRTKKGMSILSSAKEDSGIRDFLVAKGAKE